MSFSGKSFTAALTLLLASGASQPAPAAGDPTPLTPVAAPAAPEAETAPAAPAPAPIAAPAVERAAAPAEAPEAPVAPRRIASSEMDRDLECLAKVILHEAGNQSRTGQIAVAEVVMNRLKDPRRRFGSTICGVVLQRGQFFNVNAYRPHRDARWPRALEIARQVRQDFEEGDHDHVTNGGLFFRAHYGAPFRGRTRVARIGDHAFYR